MKCVLVFFVNKNKVLLFTCYSFLHILHMHKPFGKAHLQHLCWHDLELFSKWHCEFFLHCIFLSVGFQLLVRVFLCVEDNEEIIGGATETSLERERCMPKC